MNKIVLLLVTLSAIPGLQAMDNEKALKLFNEAQKKGKGKAAQQFEQLYQRRGSDSETVSALHANLNMPETPASSSSSSSRENAVKLAKERIARSQASSSQATVFQKDDSQVDTIVALRYTRDAVNALECQIQELEKNIEEKKSSCRNLLERIAVQLPIINLEKELRGLRLKRVGAEAKRDVLLEHTLNKEGLKSNIKNTIGLLLDCCNNSQTITEESLRTLEIALMKYYDLLITTHSTSSEDKALKQIQYEFEKIASLLRSLQTHKQTPEMKLVDSDADAEKFFAEVYYRSYPEERRRDELQRLLEESEKIEQEVQKASRRIELMQELEKAAHRLGNIAL